MSKLIFWIVVVFAVLFALRLINTAKAKTRADDAGRAARDAGAAGRGDGALRALRRVPAARRRHGRSPTGLTCGDADCARQR